MKRKFVLDREINLNEIDFLKTKVYANNLTEVIKNTDIDKVFTIGLFGSWGTGKSSIIETSKQDFDQTKIKFITYDAWQYVNDSFRRMFLRKLREKLNYEETDLMKKFYENELTEIGNTYQLSSARVAMILCCLILLLAILAFIPFELDYKFPIYAIVSLLGLLITIVSGAFHQLKISISKPYLFAPEQFEECFKNIVSNSLKKSNFISKWVNGDKSIQNLDKLVIVIDNIDRCSNDVAYNLLADIKTFLSTEPYSIVFVIPVDDAALRKHIVNSSKHSGDCDKDKEEFLRKFFNITIRIKPYNETDMFEFAKQINDKHKLNFKPETLNIASKEYAKNPRRVIQLFNNLLAELNYDYGMPEFAQRNETLICCILIIREEFSDYYERVINSPKIFVDASVPENLKKNGELTRFIRIAHTAIDKIELEDLCRVLVSSYNMFDDVPIDLKDAIQTFNTKMVLAMCNSDKERIIDYIIDRLDNAARCQLIETDMASYFDLVTEINKLYPLDVHIAKRIDEKVVPHFPAIISRTKNHENICNYAHDRECQGNSTIMRALIENSMRSENQASGMHWAHLFNAVLKVFNDKETSIALSSTYTLYSHFVDYHELSVDQFNYLVSDEYVQQKISDLPTKEDSKEILFDTGTEEYQEVKWLFENKQNIDEDTYAILFHCIVGEEDGVLTMRGKTVEDIVEILTFANPLLNLIPDRKLTKQPETLYGLIVNDRKMPHPTYPNQTQYDQQRNFIDECIEAKSNMQDIIDFVINVYRITSGKIDVSKELKKILAKNTLDKKLIELVNAGYSLAPILVLIFDDAENYEYKNNFDDKDRLALLKHCFNQKTKGKYLIDDAKAKKKIDELLTFAQNHKCDDVFTLLESLTTQERYKTILSNLIAGNNCDFINSLPTTFLELAIDAFKEDNYLEFANNFDLLSIIIQHGICKQKELVVRIITAKLNENQDIERIANLTGLMENVPEYDPDGFLTTHLKSYLRKNKGNIDDNIKKIFEKRLKTIKKATKQNHSN